MSSSQPGKIASSASRMVTFEPRSASSEANSHPTTPPPMTATDAGSFSRSKNSSEVMTQRPSTSNPGQAVRHRPGGEHDVAPGDHAPGVIAVDDLDAAARLQGARADERRDLAALEQALQALPELVDDRLLALLAPGEVERHAGHVDAELLGSLDRSAAPPPSRGIPWPGYSPGAGTSRRPCPARRWRPRARPRLRRARWRTRPGPPPITTMSNSSSLAIDRLSSRPDDARPRARPPGTIPIATARVVLAFTRRVLCGSLPFAPARCRRGLAPCRGASR